MRYTLAEKHSMLFINCKTEDGKEIVCCGNISLHNREMKIYRDDTIEFKNVKPYEHTKAGYRKLNLKITGESVVSIINYDNSKKQVIPSTGSFLPAIQRRVRPSGLGTQSVVSFRTLKPATNEKSKLLFCICKVICCLTVIGTIQNELKFEQAIGSDPDFKHGVYVTTIIPFNGDQVRLIISKDFGNWPAKFLQSGEIISVTGEETEYYGMKARFVKPGSHLDVASDEEVALARRLPRPNVRSRSIGRRGEQNFFR